MLNIEAVFAAILLNFYLVHCFNLKHYASSSLFQTSKKSSTQVFSQSEFDPFAREKPVLETNRLNEPLVRQRIRPRRNRKSEAVRAMIRENIVTPKDFIYPLFIHEADYKEEISSMPDCFRLSLNAMMEEVEEAISYGVSCFILFPKVPDNLKTNYAEEAYNPNGIVPRALGMLKMKFPNIIVCTDIALDPYSSMDGKIMNDITIMQLQKQAVMQARAGSDIVAPSGRDALDSEGFTDVSIMAYTAKYASAYYGPFRDALDSHPGFGDKKTYQQ
eukprot:gene32564-42180_t